MEQGRDRDQTRIFVRDRIGVQFAQASDQSSREVVRTQRMREPSVRRRGECVVTGGELLDVAQPLKGASVDDAADIFTDLDVTVQRVADDAPLAHLTASSVCRDRRARFNPPHSPDVMPLREESVF